MAGGAKDWDPWGLFTVVDPFFGAVDGAWAPILADNDDNVEDGDEDEDDAEEGPGDNLGMEFSSSSPVLVSSSTLEVAVDVEVADFSLQGAATRLSSVSTHAYA